MKQRSRATWVVGVLWLLIAFGVLAFGAVYKWAYQPLLVSAAIVGAYGLLIGTTGDRRALWATVVMFSAIGVVIVLQLIPVPRSWLLQLSPGADAILRRYDVPYALAVARGVEPSHALSIEPLRTWHAFTIFAALAVFVPGAAILLARIRLSVLVRLLAALGLAVGVFGIIQRATSAHKIYWVWTPEMNPTGDILYNAFGPFVNRNHFAGWMVMAASLVMGYICALFARAGASTAGRPWRERAAFLSSGDAGTLIFVSFAFLIMALSTVWSVSRSGIAAFAVAVSLMGLVAAWRSRGVGPRLFAVLLPVAAMAAVVGWKGWSSLFGWYGNTSTLAWRVQLWRDSVPIVRDFWHLGAGLDTYGVTTLLYPMTDRLFHIEQAHNDYLQLFIEGGVVLALLAALTLVVIALRVRAAFREPQPTSVYWIRVGAVVGILAIGVQELSDFSLQLPGNAVLFCTLLAIALHRAVPPARA